MIKEIIAEEFQRRIIEEGLDRIKKCCNILDDNELWYRHNPNTNSVGNLILHLTGNVRQYILAGIDRQDDIRTRDEEFDPNNRKPKDEIIEQLNGVIIRSNAVVKNLSQEQLSEERKVQGFDESVLSIIIHVIEHFSYHVGQITFFTKYIKDIDTGYYAGLDLNATS